MNRTPRPHGWTPGAFTIVAALLGAVGAAWLDDTLWPASLGALRGRYPEVVRIAPWSDRREQFAVVREWLAADSGHTRGPWFYFGSKAARKTRAARVALRKAAVPEVDAVLVRVARDRELHDLTRMCAFAVLARPGNDAAMEALADVALDDDASPDLRVRALRRMPRFGAPLPRRLHPLLDNPMGMPYDCLDGTTAIVLGATGDFESPTLIARQYRRSLRLSRTVVGSSAEEAIRRVAGTAPAVADVFAEIDAARAKEEPVSESLARLADAFDAWLAEHPEARATEWERRHERRVAAARALEERFGTVDRVAACDDASIDVVAAVRALGGDRGPDDTDVLVDVEHLADWLRPHLAACRAPHATLATMQRMLVPRGRPAAENTSDVSFLLRIRAGNCMAWTLLYVALGDRLGLPLRPVEAPGHVFVRWDDGTTRVNWDPSNDGASWSDEEVARRFGGDAAPDRRMPRPMTRRALVSFALSNAAAAALTHDDDPDVAARLASDAARLEPANLPAQLHLAAAHALAGRVSELRDAAQAAEAFPDFTPSVAEYAARSLAAGGLCEEVLAILDRHPGDAPASRARRVIRARSLGRVGRHAEVQASARRLALEFPDDVEVATLDVATAFGVEPREGWETLAAALRRFAPKEGAPRYEGTGPELLVGVAERLLDDAPHDDARARLALDLVELLVDGGTSRAPDEVRRALGRRPEFGAGHPRDDAGAEALTPWLMAIIRRFGTDASRDRVRVRAHRRLGETDQADAILRENESDESR